MQACISHCQGCHAVCLVTAQACLEMGSQHAAAGHIRLLLDCAEICQTSANFMLRGSPLHVFTCGACAEACERCAEACATFWGDAMMHTCAETCQACAESCRKMSMEKVA
jgi:hypothetical protein